MFAAEATSRGCIVLAPMGGELPYFDAVVLTPSGKFLTVQVKAQSTTDRKTIGLVTAARHIRERADVIALFSVRDGWHLIPKRVVKKTQRSIPILQWRKYLNNWGLLK